MRKKVVKMVTKIEPVSQKLKPHEVAAIRVCAYCRVSTDGADQKNSFEAQVDYYTRLISEKEGWVCGGIYADKARSGTKIVRRDDFNQMISDCRLGKIDMIITKSVTRFARNTVDSIQAIRELKALGIAVYFEKERVNTLSEDSEQLITILSSIAQGESESISANMRLSTVWRFKNGTFILSTPPYGYRKNENGDLVIHPEEAVIARKIFEEYLGGKGSYTIAKELEQVGIPAARAGTVWNENTIKGILQNCAYEGDLLQQKTFSEEVIPFNKKINHGELPQYLIIGNHEPIITREEAEAVRQIYEYRRQKQCVDDVSVYQSRYAFSGRIVCGECGIKFRRQKIYIGKPYEKVQWCCYQHIKDRMKCSQKAIRQDIIEELFIRLWNRMATNYEDILYPMLASLKSIRSNPQDEQEMNELENQIQELKKQSHMLRKVLSEGGIGSAIFIEKRNQLDHDLETAWRRHRNLREQRTYGWEIRQTEFLLSVFKNRPPIIEHFDEELFRLVIEQITVYLGKRLEFQLKNGLQLEEIYRKEVR
nr:recombinase family protein [Hungatella effluvii]